MKYTTLCSFWRLFLVKVAWKKLKGISVKKYERFPLFHFCKEPHSEEEINTCYYLPKEFFQVSFGNNSFNLNGVARVGG